MSETKAMSQESEVTKCPTWFAESVNEYVWGVFNGQSEFCVRFNTATQANAVAGVLNERDRLASAPPADARLREAVIEECAKKIRNDLLWAAPELWESKIARRIADALPHLDGRPISAEARDIIIEECASAIEDAFRSAPNDRASGYRQNAISHGCIEAARVVRALRSSPAASEPRETAFARTNLKPSWSADARNSEWSPEQIEAARAICSASVNTLCLSSMKSASEAVCMEVAKHAHLFVAKGAPLSPSKGARETPALDAVLIDYYYASAGALRSDKSPVPGETRDTLLDQARAELSALKSAAPERPAMAVEAAGTFIDRWLVDRGMTRYDLPQMLAEDPSSLDSLVASALTPAAASPTVKMPTIGGREHQAIGLLLRMHNALGFGIGDVSEVRGQIADFLRELKDGQDAKDAARLNPPASPQDGKERA